MHVVLSGIIMRFLANTLCMFDCMYVFCIRVCVCGSDVVKHDLNRFLGGGQYAV